MNLEFSCLAAPINTLSALRMDASASSLQQNNYGISGTRHRHNEVTKLMFTFIINRVVTKG